ncbi:hypothetical protein [Streptomyces sp. NBC_01483]|uniref:hypothetical protein n=1 Tax=Streptomyces sp. NBC_01483 TaxID=2903883 RepID=UPI002E31B044|nr:hypothetical protein [Streptomyces sp. NBC_01483]
MARGRHQSRECRRHGTAAGAAYDGGGVEVSWQRPSAHSRLRRPWDIVCTSPIAQQAGQPRNATKPTGRSSKLTQPMTGASVIEAAMDPKPTVPRAR